VRPAGDKQHALDVALRKGTLVAIENKLGAPEGGRA